MKSKSISKMTTTTSIIMFSVVLVIGIAFSALAIKLNTQKIPDNYVETKAEITKIKEDLLPGFDDSDDATDAEKYEYQVFVKYSYNDKEYKNKEYGNYDSSMKVGDKVLVYINPDNPSEFISDPSGNFITIIIGVVIVLIGCGGIGYNIYKKKRGLV